MNLTRIDGVVVTQDAMGKLLAPDELWELIEPILPRHLRSCRGDKPRTPDRVMDCNGLTIAQARQLLAHVRRELNYSEPYVNPIFFCR
jgi:hypothetical protein